MSARAILAAALAASLAAPAAAQMSAGDRERQDSLVYGLGSIIGVAAYNTVTTAVAAGVSSAGAAAMGAVGAVGATTGFVWLRNATNGEDIDPARLLPTGAGALAGVAAGDLAAKLALGYSPFAAAAGGVMPFFGFSAAGIAGSLYTYTTGALGARAAEAVAR